MVLLLVSGVVDVVACVAQADAPLGAGAAYDALGGYGPHPLGAGRDLCGRERCTATRSSRVLISGVAGGAAVGMKLGR
jgi:hypothetical protein